MNVVHQQVSLLYVFVRGLLVLVIVVKFAFYSSWFKANSSLVSLFLSDKRTKFLVFFFFYVNIKNHFVFVFVCKDACARVSCNYGTCINEGTSYRCECQRGYEGAACDRPIDPCSSFVCYNGGVCYTQEYNQPVCQCAPGYRGTNCYEIDGMWSKKSSGTEMLLLLLFLLIVFHCLHLHKTKEKKKKYNEGFFACEFPFFFSFTSLLFC